MRELNYCTCSSQAIAMMCVQAERGGKGTSFMFIVYLLSLYPFLQRSISPSQRATDIHPLPSVFTRAYFGVGILRAAFISLPAFNTNRRGPRSSFLGVVSCVHCACCVRKRLMQCTVPTETGRRTNRHPIISTWPNNYFDASTKHVGTGLTGATTLKGEKRPLRLPKSTGDNKLTEKMVPGYTGYIPRMPFKFGNTYKEDCDVCIDDFLDSTQRHDGKVRTLKQTVVQARPLQPKTDERVVIKALNFYRDQNPGKVLLEDKRESREAPMPGYRGFIPRQGVTELGLGARYHETCDKSLNVFYDETDRHAVISKPGYVPKTTLSNEEAKASLQLTKDNQGTLLQRRLYKQIGMVPKYTGYLPQMRFRFGHTYGDASRSLPVCSHKQTNYGSHLQTLQQSA